MFICDPFSLSACQDVIRFWTNIIELFHYHHLGNLTNVSIIGCEGGGYRVDWNNGINPYYSSVSATKSYPDGIILWILLQYLGSLFLFLGMNSGRVGGEKTGMGARRHLYNGQPKCVRELWGFLFVHKVVVISRHVTWRFT